MEVVDRAWRAGRGEASRGGRPDGRWAQGVLALGFATMGGAAGPTAATTATNAGAAVLLALALLAAVGLGRVARGKTERAVDEEHERIALSSDVVASVIEGVVVLDKEGAIVAVNPAWERLRRRSSDPSTQDTDDRGRSYLEVVESVSPGAGAVVRAAIAPVVDGEQSGAEIDLLWAVDEDRWIAVVVTPLHGRAGGLVAVHRDVTERTRTAAELESRASRDPLTGLLNRAAFEAAARAVMARTRDAGASVGALFIDVDDFKAINDTYHHGVGDAVLQAVAERIASSVRDSDLVGRQGGDEFVVLIPDADASVTRHTADRILESFHSPVAAVEVEVKVRVSIGVVVLDDPSRLSVAVLMARADRAMYEAKRSGGARVSVSR